MPAPFDSDRTTGQQARVLVDFAVLGLLGLSISCALGDGVDIGLPLGQPTWPVATAALLVTLVFRLAAWGMPVPQAASALIRVTARRHFISDALIAGLSTRFVIILSGVVVVAATAPRDLRSVAGLLSELPNHWDASWYLGVAAGGYRWVPEASQSRLALFPAFPLSVRGAARLLHIPDEIGPWLWVGVAASVSFFILALGYVGALAERLGSPQVAQRSVWLTALFPYSLFHGQVYSESLFLLGAVAATYHAYRQQYLFTVVFGLVAGLTRPTGCLIAILVAGPVLADWASLGARRSRVWAAAALFAPIAGTCAYSLYVFWLTGDPLTWLTDQGGWGRAETTPLEVVTNIWRVISERGAIAYLYEHPYEVGNFFALLFALVLLIPIATRFGWAMSLFVLASVAAPLFIGGLPSMGRYSAVLFPMFLCAATGEVPRWVFVLLGIAQVFMAGLFYLDKPMF